MHDLRVGGPGLQATHKVNFREIVPYLFHPRIVTKYSLEIFFFIFVKTLSGVYIMRNTMLGGGDGRWGKK